jgi:hypothetical protein
MFHVNKIKFFFLFKTLFYFSAPPTRPARFHSREELKRYLQLVCLYLILNINKIKILFKVHEYYAIIGRPRFGRSSVKARIDPDELKLFYFFDTNRDNSISLNEFHDRLEK